MAKKCSTVPVVQSTDGRPYDPIFSFWQMLARKDGVSGHVFGLPEQKLTRAEALRMLKAIRGAWLLEGLRGSPGRDIDALCDMLVRLSDLVADCGDCPIRLRLERAD